MKHIRYPHPLKPGDTIGITSPSAGIGPTLEPRYQFCIQTLHALGFNTHEGSCLRNSQMVSASAHERAHDLLGMLLDDSISAIIPPWGGELLINILPLLDFDLLATATPKWILGYSDLTTLMFPYTLITGISTAHGSNLLETPIKPCAEHLHWSQVLAFEHGSTFTQHAARFLRDIFQDWATFPKANSWLCSTPTHWKPLHHEDDPTYDCSVKGRLIGGCLDVVSMLPGTRYGQVNRFASEYAPEGLLLYLENSDANTAGISRTLSSIRLSGWLEHANALILGRTEGAQLREFTMREAIMSAVGDLAIPVFYDVDIGHVPPQMILINGALAELHYSTSDCWLTQSLA